MARHVVSKKGAIKCGRGVSTYVPVSGSAGRAGPQFN